MALIFDLVPPQEITGFVREIEIEQIMNRLILGQVLPNQTLNGIAWRADVGTLDDEESAELRSWDAESSIGGRQGLRRLLGEIAPSSRKYKLGEEEILRLRTLEQTSADPRIPAIFDDAAKGARAVSMRFERLRAEALVTGKITINENGVHPEPVDFGRLPAHTDVAPSTVWSDHVNATPVSDEFGFIQTYKSNNHQLLPGAAFASDVLVNHMLLNEEYRHFAAVNNVVPAFLNLDQLNTIRAAYNLPPIIPYNVRARIGGVQTRLIPVDRLVYVPPAEERLGWTFTGVTAEALKLAQARQIQQDQMPGMVCVIDETSDPVGIWTKTVAAGFPVLANPNMSFVAQVL